MRQGGRKCGRRAAGRTSRTAGRVGEWGGRGSRELGGWGQGLGGGVAEAWHRAGRPSVPGSPAQRPEGVSAAWPPSAGAGRKARCAEGGAGTPARARSFFPGRRGLVAGAGPATGVRADSAPGPFRRILGPASPGGWMAPTSRRSGQPSSALRFLALCRRKTWRPALCRSFLICS